MSETIRINSEEARGESDDRFDRFRLIGWWDQKKLTSAKVVVIGAGALGNEIIKNLALLGIGNIFIADKDRIENSNLSRSVLYRESDTGRFKAEVAAQSAKVELAKISTTARAAQYARGRRAMVRPDEVAAGVTMSVTPHCLPTYHCIATAVCEFLVTNAKVDRTR